MVMHECMNETSMYTIKVQFEVILVVLSTTIH